MDRFALNNISEGIIFINSGRISFVNKTLGDFIQYSTTELLNSDHAPFFTTNSEFKFFNLVKEIQLHSIPMNDVFEVMNKDNEVINVNIQISSYDQNSVCCVLNLPTQDNCSKVQLQRDESLTRIVEEHRILSTFFEHSPDLLGLIELSNNDTELTTVYRSHKGLQQSRLTASELGVPDEVLQLWIKHYKSAAQLQRPIYFETENNDTYQLNCAIHIEGNRYMYISKDITVRKKLEFNLKKYQQNLEREVQERTRALENALLLKSRFLAIMSHEIRTPMTGILGTLSLLATSSLTDEQTELVRIAHVCGEQLLLVINDVLDFTKMEENKVALSEEEFSLRQVIAESIDVVSFDAEKKGLVLICDVDSNTQDRITGDRGRLRQILVNLLSNAVKFSSEGEIVLSTITTNARRPSRDFPKTMIMDEWSSEILFSVRDSGVGIPKGSQGRIFEPFMQTESGSKNGGSGLGLSISKRLTELMGGKMWFESEEGQGSTFYFTLITKRDPKFIPRRLSQHNISDEAKRILIIETSETLGEVLHRYLTIWGYKAYSACSLLSAQELLYGNKYDLILVDINYGMEWISTLKDYGHVTVTSFRRERLEKYEVLRKPLHEQNFKEYIRKYFSEPVHVEYENSRKILICRSAPYTPPSPTTNPMAQLRVLVAEDNLMNQKVIYKLLINFGFVYIQMVDNGLKAFEAVQHNTYDLVLMDVMMPVCNGIQATELIRKEFPEKPVIIALTADAFAENRKRCIDSGMNDVITKPIKKLKLLETIGKFFPDVKPTDDE